MSRLVVILALTFALCACGQSEPSKKSAKATKADEDALLLKDVSRAGPELERRLAASMRVENGLLIVHDPVMGQIVSYVLPTTSSWMVSCGIGVSVVLGNSVTGDGSSVGNDVEINLANGTVDQKVCDILGPSGG